MSLQASVRHTGLALMLALVAFCRPSLGQQSPPAPLPTTLVSQTTPLSDEQSGVVRTYVNYWMGELAGGGPAQVHSSRLRLIEPLKARSISVAFRQAYSTAAVPALSRAVAADDSLVRINALLVAGELASDDSARLIEGALSHADPNTRYSAARGTQLAFEKVASFAPAMTPARAGELVQAIARALNAEQDPLVFAVQTRALGAAAVIPGNNPLRSAAPLAANALAGAVSQRLTNVRFPTQQLNRELQTATGALSMLQHLLGPGANAPEGVPKAAAETAGHVIALIDRAREANALPKGEPGPALEEALMPYRTALIEAGRTLDMAVHHLDASANPTTFQAATRKLDEFLSHPTRESLTDFRLQVRNLILGPGAPITRPPLGFSDGHFLK